MQDLKRLAGNQFSEPYLDKFLVARAGDPQAAYEMLKHTLEWRALNDIDSLPDKVCCVPNNIRGFSPEYEDQSISPNSPTFPSNWHSVWTNLGGGCYHFQDKEGFPLYIERLVSLNRNCSGFPISARA